MLSTPDESSSGGKRVRYPRREPKIRQWLIGRRLPLRIDQVERAGAVDPQVPNGLELTVAVVQRRAVWVASVRQDVRTGQVLVGVRSCNSFTAT